MRKVPRANSSFQIVVGIEGKKNSPRDEREEVRTKKESVSCKKRQEAKKKSQLTENAEPWGHNTV